MTKHSRHGRRWNAGLGALAPALIVLLMSAAPALAWVDLEEVDGPRYDRGNGIMVVDGSYVMNVGELQMNITNHGLIGSNAGAVCSWCSAPSAQWPAGSGVEYLYSAGLWVGGVLLGEQLVSTGQFEREFRPRDELEDTIYEAISRRITRPTTANQEAGGQRLPESGADDDGDGLIDEEILNGYDDDEDGLIDEDFGQIGNQMMVCTMYDNTRQAQEIYPDHTPLNLKVVQSAYAWENDDADDFIGFEFQITNIGVATIENVYIGFFADADIGDLSTAGRAEDDLAGSFTGPVRAKDGSWVRVSVGYMYDDDQDGGSVPGYIGILFLDHDTDPEGRLAPRSVQLRSFNHFSGRQPFDNGGDPTNDAERYELLSGTSIDNDVLPAKQNDYRFLVSAGPFSELPPDDTLTFQAAIVVGNGLEGLKANCAEAAQTYFGNYFNLDSDVETGTLGRETRICLSEFGGTGSDNPIYSFVQDFMDPTCMQICDENDNCRPSEFLLSRPFISSEDLDEQGCIYVNMDNCIECFRQAGEDCTGENQLIETPGGVWNCNNPQISDDAKAGCTGIGGNEFNITWLVGMAPPPPGMRLWPTDNAVHIYWDNRSETTPDIRINRIDFESYRVWRADNWDRPFGSSVDNGPESGLWQLIAEYDIVNEFVQTRELTNGATVLDTLPLGRNTGLEAIRYEPRVLSDPRFDGLAEAMQTVVDTDTIGLYQSRPPLRDALGTPVSELADLLPWEGYPAALDTFFMVTERVALRPTHVAKRPVSFYEYVDTSVHNGFIYFYSVTASDHAVDLDGTNLTVTGEGLVGDPGSSFVDISPGATAQTAEERAREGVNIYVYPNPATRDALEEFQELNPNEDDPTGVRVCFANLPMARNTIEIYSLNGDLIQTIDHDGTDGFGEACWNLVSRNGQEIVSGIYLYSVQSSDSRFDDFIGKFVVIR
ncbi:MAG TPA: hypothetical protein P5571_03110 [Candidatus Krumholzibacteria bacterium]|nr:hypothetical protein [Candidatus Krumholzibacteria bacterium]HRX50331.1 hypothetical protein [Candidatus Krumholzibacteria bacterium]